MFKCLILCLMLVLAGCGDHSDDIDIERFSVQTDAETYERGHPFGVYVITDSVDGKQYLVVRTNRGMDIQEVTPTTEEE